MVMHEEVSGMWWWVGVRMVEAGQVMGSMCWWLGRRMLCGPPNLEPLPRCCVGLQNPGPLTCPCALPT